MATGKNIHTYFEGAWHAGDAPIMRAADHGAWLGTTVFDGARYVNGLSPDLDLQLRAGKPIGQSTDDHPDCQHRRYDCHHP